MSIVHKHIRSLKIVTIYFFASLLIIGCTSQAYSVNNPDSRDDSLGTDVEILRSEPASEELSKVETGEQLNDVLLDQVNEPLIEITPDEGGFGIPRMEAGQIQGTYIGAHDVGHSFLNFVDEYEEKTLDKISPESSAASGPIVTPDLCIYTAKKNVNCRVSDYVESSLIAILMQGEEAQLLYLNPTFTHGKFELLNNSHCWIPLGLLHGPSDPYKMCQVYVVDAPLSRERSNLDESDSPVCSSGLDEASCLAAGGNWVDGGAVGVSYCNCG